MRKSSSFTFLHKESRRRCDCGGKGFCEWTFEGGLKAIGCVGSDGIAPVTAQMYGVQYIEEGLPLNSGGTAFYRPERTLFAAARGFCFSLSMNERKEYVKA